MKHSTQSVIEELSCKKVNTQKCSRAESVFTTVLAKMCSSSTSCVCKQKPCPVFKNMSESLKQLKCHRCKLHIEQVVNKICTACYALRNIKHIVPMDTLRIIYFAHIHSIISYGIIFWGSSSYSEKKLWELYQTLDQETPAWKYLKVWK